VFYLYGILFWVVLVIVAIINGTIRDFTYKPWLEPYIGKWAHQISVLTGFGLMLLATIGFLKILRVDYARRDLLLLGLIWLVMTIIFEFGFGRLRGKSWQELFEMYYFWRGDLWLFLLIGTVFLPLLAHSIIHKP
jgi:hypothetical protein